MKFKSLFTSSIALGAALAAAAGTIDINVHPDQATDTVSRMIYGQFAEHLGACVYEGIWVGEDSPIPNTKGYRNDAPRSTARPQGARAALARRLLCRRLSLARRYRRPQNRPTLINNNWGGTVEDNSFGTHEFFDLCELAGIEPYLSVNIGSGTVQGSSPVGGIRHRPQRSPGPRTRRQRTYRALEAQIHRYRQRVVGCGGNMRPEYYADNYRRYSTYMRNQPENKLYRIASGASDYDYNWTKVLMERVGRGRMDGLSLHYYTVDDWKTKGSATQFDETDYYATIGKALEIDTVLNKHIAIMDKYDPKKKVGLLVDEWGTWFDEEPGSTPGHLLQQNTMRDAMVAALTLNIFHNHADRVRMTNIAQLANVLQTMWYTKGRQVLQIAHLLRIPHVPSAPGCRKHPPRLQLRDFQGQEGPPLSRAGRHSHQGCRRFNHSEPYQPHAQGRP